MARKKLLRSRILRLSIDDDKLVARWAREQNVSVAAVFRDFIRQENERRSWANRDNMSQLENAAAERAA